LSFSLSFFLFFALWSLEAFEGRGGREGGRQNLGHRAEKREGSVRRGRGSGKKGGKKKLRKVAGTEIKGCRGRELFSPPPCRHLAPPPLPFSQKWRK